MVMMTGAVNEIMKNKQKTVLTSANVARNTTANLDHGNYGTHIPHTQAENKALDTKGIAVSLARLGRHGAYISPVIDGDGVCGQWSRGNRNPETAPQ